MTGYTKKFDKNVSMSFRVNNKQLLKNCNEMWEKIHYCNTFSLLQYISIITK